MLGIGAERVHWHMFGESDHGARINSKLGMSEKSRSSEASGHPKSSAVVAIPDSHVLLCSIRSRKEVADSA